MPRGFPWISGERKRFIFLLTCIALISAIPRLVLGGSQFIEYDGYWHVFIAQQDKWSNFWEDIRANAHPPLYFLILKLIIHFGRTLLIYRSISLITGVVSIFQVGWIAQKIIQSQWWACIAALAYGLAMPAIIVSCEVRSYMLSVLFVLLSLSWLLELTASPDKKHEFRLRAGFVIATVCACLSHYYAFFYAGAASVLLALWYTVRRFRGEQAAWTTELATILPLPAVVVVLYETHANLKAVIQGHLLPFYYDPKGTESVPAFLIRNWKNMLNLFLPWQISSDSVALVLFAISVLCGLALLPGFFRGRDASAVRASWTAFIAAGILGEIVFTAVIGKYPFGGDLRQQFILFPFFVLCAAAAAGMLTRRMPNVSRSVIAAAAAVAIIVVSAVRFEQYPKSSENVLSDQIKVFNKLAPEPAGVYLDQVNLITFFIYHHDWQWTSLPAQPVPGIDIYRIRQGQREMLIFRDLTEWNVRAESMELYHKLAQCLRAGDIAEISVFGVLESPPAVPYSSSRLMRLAIARDASNDAMCVQRLKIDPLAWYATFRGSGCTEPALAPPRLKGTFDDNADEIVYSGPWTHGSYPPASEGTSSYANFPGSTAHLDFVGTQVTWVYAKAPNRGFASVRIDGAPRDDIDLYSSTIDWQARTTFGGLSPGNHSLELMVSGRKDAAATDRYIDVDALIVR
ncbi:MAG TPA: hypothetical protein VK789_04470 [Bryobacteraceae bacterium]|nr:hypothetical protein [Bryobacteraceae bacterium]